MSDQKLPRSLWIAQFFLGISSGLPLLLTGSTLQAWMTDQKVDLTLIGIFAFVKTPYTLKFLWSPLVDRFRIPRLPRRKGWIVCTQIALFFAILLLAQADPLNSPWWTAALALAVSLCSATQDIVIDAFRIESFPGKFLGLASAIHTTGYRVGMIIAGAGALVLADILPWSGVYQIMAGMLALGIVGTLLVPEKEFAISLPKSLRESVIEPFRDFFQQRGALVMLLFILLYKIGDNMAANMNVTFILSQGYTKTEYAAIAKGLGMLATIVGGILGGALLLRIGIMKSLIGFGVLQALSTAAFSALDGTGHSEFTLSWVMAFENLASGMGSAAYLAFMGSLISVRFTATQFALMSSLMAVSGSLFAMPTGFMAKHMGWSGFYVFCALIAVPGLLMLPKIARFRAQVDAQS
jgi:PAT family beta-lactamase induction signal transducer AmpG